jgi:hypothetical protein
MMAALKVLICLVIAAYLGAGSEDSLQRRHYFDALIQFAGFAAMLALAATTPPAPRKRDASRNRIVWKVEATHHPERGWIIEATPEATDGPIGGPDPASIVASCVPGLPETRPLPSPSACECDLCVTGREIDL